MDVAAAHLRHLLSVTVDSPDRANIPLTFHQLHREWWTQRQSDHLLSDWPDFVHSVLGDSTNDCLAATFGDRVPTTAAHKPDVVNRFQNASKALDLTPGQMFLCFGRDVPYRAASMKLLSSLVKGHQGPKFKSANIIQAVRDQMYRRRQDQFVPPEPASIDITRAAQG